MKFTNFLQAFCHSVQQYLAFYTVVVLSLQDTMNPLALHGYTKELQEQMKYLARFCYVGPYKSTETLPKGVHLLNYLYERVMSLTNQNVLNVFYSVLHSCCKVYFK